MSIVNVWMEHGQAIVAVDTRAESDTRHIPGGKYVHLEAAKLVPLPHANMVLANRGDLAFFYMFVGNLVNEQISWSMDVFIDRAVDICNALFDLRMRDFKALYEGRPFETEIFAVGWSDKLQRVVGFICERGTEDSAFKLTQIHSWSAGPQAWDVWPDVDSVPRFNTVETMIPTAREQVRYFRSLYPDRAIGGKLIVASVTRNGIGMRTVADLG